MPEKTTVKKPVKKRATKKATVKKVIEPKKDSELTMAKLMHIFFAFGWFLTPLGAILAPLVIWLLKKDESEIIDFQGRQILNFTINILIAMAASVVLAITIIGIVLSVIIWIVLLITAVVGFVLAIINAVTITRNNYKEIGYPCFLRVL